MGEIEALQAAIDALEAQRPTLGDAAVDAALAPLRERIDALQATSTAGERKQITVLFADLSGFTALSERTDAEVARNLANVCFERIGQVVRRYGGYIDKFIGDELMVLFGAPVAMEDHAARALHAAQDIRDTFAAFSREHPQLQDHPLDLHFGVNSGLVVAGRHRHRVETRVYGDGRSRQRCRPARRARTGRRDSRGRGHTDDSWATTSRSMTLA